jgi:hypothetical protein
MDRDRDLPSHLQARIRELSGKNDLIHRFQKTRAEFPVDLEGSIHNLIGDSIFSHYPLPIKQRTLNSVSRNGATTRRKPLFFMGLKTLRRCGVA